MGLTAYDCGSTMAVLIGEVVNTEWAVLCSSNLHLCLIDNHADATKLKVIPKNPRIPKSHALELHCESQCDSHLKHSLKLSWSKDGKPFDINGTEDGRLVHCWVNAGLCVSCRFHIRKKQSPNIIHTTLKYKNSNVLFFKSVFRRSSSICCLFYVLLASVQYVILSVVSPLRAGNRSQVWDAVYLHRFRSSPMGRLQEQEVKGAAFLVFLLGGGVLLMCSTSLNQVSENFCLLLRPLPQEIQLLLSHCLLKSLSHCILKRQSVSSPFSLSVSHKFFLPIKSQLYLVVISLWHVANIDTCSLSVGVACRILGRYQNSCGQVHSIEGYSIISHTFI